MAIFVEIRLDSQIDGAAFRNLEFIRLYHISNIIYIISRDSTALPQVAQRIDCPHLPR